MPLMTACPGNDTSGNEEIGTESGTGTDTLETGTTAETGTTDATTETGTTDPTTETTTDPTTETGTTDPTTETGTTDPTTETGTTDPTTETGGVCGDAVIDPGEECEGADLGGNDCTTLGLGFTGGELICTAECLYDTSGCVVAECGNGVLEPGEDCDGADLGAATCADFGFSAGELTCAPDCTIVADACTNCGDDLIQDPEVCDGADLGGQDCVALGYDAGTLACNATCDAFDESACTSSQTFMQCAMPNTPIPVFGIGTASVINVPAMGTVLDVNVSITATHTWVGDVEWRLTKGNTNTLVIDNPNCSSDNIDVTLDDESANGSVQMQCNPQPPALSGVRTPANTLSIFDNAAMSGDWSLQPNDTANGDGGTFQQWCLIIEYQ